MADERRFADVESMRPVFRAVFGRGRPRLRVERLAHGSKKGAYRLTMDDGGTALVYVWDDSEDYWQGVLPEGARRSSRSVLARVRTRPVRGCGAPPGICRCPLPRASARGQVQGLCIRRTSP